MKSQKIWVLATLFAVQGFRTSVMRRTRLQPLSVLKWEASTVTSSNIYMKELDELCKEVAVGDQISRLITFVGSLWRVGIALMNKNMNANDRNKVICDEIMGLGPVCIKLGQSLSCRPDLCGEEMAAELKRLVDGVPQSISQSECLGIIRNDFHGNPHLKQIESTLSDAVACASLGQVHKAHIPEYGDVAVKIQRPNLTELVTTDMSIALMGARWLQKNWGISSGRPRDALLFKTDILLAVRELGSRLIEELDYKNEAENLDIFSGLYAEGGTAHDLLPPPGIVVPHLVPSLCSKRVITMTWINETSKLLEAAGDGEGVKAGASFTLSALNQKEQDNLKQLSILGIECSLSQLLETGYLHADPHSGNLLKGPDGKLVYLDFGLVSYIPEQVREGLVCAILFLIEKDFRQLAEEFDDLLLLEPEYLKQNVNVLQKDLEKTAARILVYDPSARNPEIPKLNFDELVVGFTDIALKHEFITPPYFLSNIRAIGALEGFALAVDPDFNLFKVIYPFILKRVLLGGSRKSQKIDATFRRIVLRPDDGLLNLPKCLELLDDAASLGGIRKDELVRTFLSQPEGRRFALEVARKYFSHHCKRPIKRALRVFTTYLRRFIGIFTRTSHTI